MPLVTGKLTDFGLDPMDGNRPRIIFKHITPGVAGVNILSSKPVEVEPARNGYFEAELAASATIAPAGYYIITLEWMELPSRLRRHEKLPYKLFVPAKGGVLADLLRVPANPALAYIGAEPPANPSPGSWWLNADGRLHEYSGSGWTFKEDLRGPAGYNATGAAEDDSAVAALIRQLSGPTKTGKAIAAAVGGVHVAAFGAAGDAVKDDTAAIQAAIDDAAARVIASQMTESGVVYLGGKYKISATIKQPPYVKVVCQSSTIIESYVAGTAWHVTPRESDPLNLYAGTLQKQQWNRGSLIDGTQGGFVIVNKRADRTGTIGLELGNRAAGETQRPLSRYSLNDVAVQGFGVGQQLNAHNHYIAFYRRLHLEVNTTDIRVGDGTYFSDNSGENFVWEDSVIAGADTAVEFSGDAMNSTFVNCSFDFLGRVFWFRKGWMRVVVQGGHIEVINEGVRRSDTGGIAVSDVTSGILPDLLIRGMVPFVTHERGVQFRGPMRLWVEMQYRSDDYEYMASEDNWLCDAGVQVRHAELINYQGMPRTSLALGELRDPVFAADPVGTAAASLTHYAVVTNANTTAAVSADGPRPGAQSLAYTIAPGNGYLFVKAKDKMPCRPGERLHAAYSYKLTTLAGSPNMAASMEFFDAAGAVLGTVSTRNFTRTTKVAGKWRTSDSPMTFTVPPGAAFYQPRFTVSNPASDGATHYISDIHIYRN